MASTADFRNGLCLEMNGDLLQIIEFQHVKPGKGGAFVRTKMRSLKTGKIIDQTFNSGFKVQTARIERHTYSFLYNDDSGYHFMHQETFEQIALQEAEINAPQYLKEGTIVEILIHAESNAVLAAELPTSVELEVTYTEPGVKGDTATNTLKPAKLETGAEINVPLFINNGDLIKVHTSENTYLERVKK